MTHLSDDELVRLCSTGLSPDARAHLDNCEPCRAAWEQQAAVWELLGRRRTESGGGSMLHAIMARAALEAPTVSPGRTTPAAQTPRVAPRALRGRAAAFQPTTLFRLAASLIFGIGAGLTLDRVVGRPQGDSGGPSVDGATVGRESLLLPEFQTASPGGFAAAILRVHPATAPKAGPTPKGHP